LFPCKSTMYQEFFETKIEFLKGVGPKRAEVLKKEFGIEKFGDLIQHYPFRYVDRTRIYRISEVNELMQYIQVKGKITNVTSVGKLRATRLVAKLKDDSGSMELVWFRGITYMREFLKAGTEYIVFGKPTMFQNQLNLIHPEIEESSEAHETINTSLQAYYLSTEKSKTKGIDSKAILRFQRQLYHRLQSEAVAETLPESILNTFNLVSRKTALLQIHFPPDEQSLARAQFRLKFEELFFLQLKLLRMKWLRSEKPGGKIFKNVGEIFNDFYRHHLPFSLTDAQKKVLREIRHDCGSGKQMNRLLQGDVGSGKTIVAFMSMLLAADNGFQSCLMAPTEILALQHFQTISRLAAGLNMQVALLTGSTRSKERSAIAQALNNGSLHFLIGTHALIEEDVRLFNPGLVVIDEQHRFGVEQRARLWQRDDVHPHVLVMTATPIPRTLAMTFYGDLDVSVIDELPPGRKPVITRHIFESQRLKLNGFLKQQIRSGRQVFIVYPLIEESEKLDFKNLEEGYSSVCRDFPMPEFYTSIIHGRMKPADREAEMKRFAEGKTQIMVATTVIEVGVDIPNASVMVVESAERFGLSQLHQLRGRVGRGARQSYCILISGNKLSDEARERLRTMVRTQDGFEIAEVDLKLRGPGDIQGTRQSGLPELKIADIARDAPILSLARTAAEQILRTDPHLQLPHHVMLPRLMSEFEKTARRWEKVS